MLAVVVVYRQWQSAEALVGQLLSDPLVARVVVVNNGGDITPPWVQDPRVGLVERPDNPGYAGGVNAGYAWLASAGAAVDEHDVLLLTHDVVLQSGCLLRLAEAASADTCGMVAPILLRKTAPAVVWSAGGRLALAQPIHLRETAAEVPYPVEWVDGAAILLPARTARRLLPMFEGYWLYFEDVDLSTVCRRLGYAVLVAPAAKALQEPSGLLDVRRLGRNKVLFARRHRSLAVLGLVLARQILRAVAEVVCAGPHVAASRLLGLVDGLRAPAGDAGRQTPSAQPARRPVGRGELPCREH